ncbi:DUF397 domain-containing protein [Streptomyces sp. NBC_01439]|uniref:DUF397 domain-containing protein n=1 Tax=Streptomyces sp. NBC_01439 TaxID=2903867 RepID=UPI002E2BBB3B|nr:DUF397 domain-containing protein [Streptomyces sp. NBC_01439]
MNTPDFTGATWRKSTFSGDNGGQCVEVAFHQGVVGLRDSKAKGKGPILAFTPQEWDAFVNGVVSGEFTQP